MPMRAREVRAALRPPFSVYGLCAALFLLLFSGLAAATDPIPPTDFSYSSPISSIGERSLSASCEPFWNSGEWEDRLGIDNITTDLSRELLSTKKAEEYYNIIHPILISTQLSNWSAPPQFFSSRSVSRSLFNVSSAVWTAQDKAHQLERLAGNFTWSNVMDVVKVVPLALLPFVDRIPLPFVDRIPVAPWFIVDKVLSIGPFSRTWVSSLFQQAMDSEQSALDAAAADTNAEFMLAQHQADALHEMGAADPSYSGAAAKAYQEWRDFLAEVARWSANPSEFPPPDSPEQRYARIWLMMKNRQEICSSPGVSPRFDSNGARLDEVFNALSGSDENALPSIARRYARSLSDANKQMNGEVDDNATVAGMAAQEAAARLAHLRSMGPEPFEPGSLPNAADASGVRPADSTGSIPEQVNRLDAQLASANEVQNSAARWKSKSSTVAWAARALENYRDATSRFGQVITEAPLIENEMNEWAARAKNSAKNEINLLQNEINSIPGGATGAQAARALQGRQDLKAVQTLLAQAAAQKRLGEQYSGYLKAYESARAALERLRTGGASDAYALKQALVHLRKLIAMANSLGFDASPFDSSYANLNAMGDPPAGAADEAQGLADSLLSQLRMFVSDDEAAYQNLSGRASMLSASNASLLSSFSAAFAPYRSAGGWSEDGLAQMASRVRPKLADWNARLRASGASAIASALCREASWVPVSERQPVAGERLEAGGHWSSRNPYPLGYDGPLALRCPLPASFLPGETTDHSSGVQSASANNGQLTLLLSSVQPDEEIYLEISSSQRPFRLQPGTCLLESNSEGRMGWKANVTLLSDQAAERLELRLPWSGEGASGPLGLKLESGEPVEGTWSNEANGSRVLVFGLSKIVPGRQMLFIKAEPDAPLLIARENQTSSPAAPGTLSDSYLLRLSGLPACDRLVMEMQEPSAGNLTSVQLLPSEGAARLLSASSVGPAHWKFALSPIPASGEALIAVSLTLSQPAQWFDQSYAKLLAKAVLSNDSIALGLLNRSKALADAGNIPSAYPLLTQTQLRLQNRQSDPDTFRAWETESANGENLAQELDNLGAALRGSGSSPPWAGSLAGWKAALAGGLKAARALADAGHAQPALDTYRSARQKYNDASLDSASKDLRTLSLALDTVRESSPADSNASAPLAEADRQRLAARNAIQDGQPAPALSALLSLRQSLDQLQAGMAGRYSAEAREQVAQAAALRGHLARLQERVANYTSLLSSMEKAGKPIYRPPLSAAQAQALLKNGRLSLAWTSVAPFKNASEAQAILHAREANLSVAQTEFSAASASVDGAYQSLEKAARARLRDAGVEVTAAQAKYNSSADPAIRTRLDGLDADLQTLQQKVDSADWGEAIVQGETLVASAHKLAGPTPPSGGEPPYLVILLTLLLAAGVVYVLVYRKPPGPKPPEGGRRLVKIDEKGLQI